MSSLLLYHSITTYKNKNIPKLKNTNAALVQENNCYNKLSLLVASFLMLTCGTLYCLSGLSEIAWTDHISMDETTCYVHFYFIITSYGSFKMFMYIALCRRLIEAFGQSLFLFIWECFIIITSLLQVVLCPIFIDLSVMPNNRPPCNIEFNDIFLISLVLYDLIVCGVNLVLFLKPLCRLTNSIQSDGQNTKKFKRKYQRLIKKNAVLASISIVTSFIIWIILGFVTGMAIMLQSIDIMVSSVAILLLFSRNKWLYRILCCCCDDRHNGNHRESQMSSIKSSPSSLSSPSSPMSKSSSAASNGDDRDVETGRTDDAITNPSDNEMESL